MEKNKIQKLINICKQKQGEYVSAGHPQTSWATTYSNDFIEASANLYLIFLARGLNPMSKISEIFIENDIRSCRGSVMDYSKIEYLFNSHIKNIIEFRLHKSRRCDFCNRQVKDLVLHVSHKHPEQWGKFNVLYGRKVKFYMDVKKRCDGCGNFVTDYESHASKCQI